MELPNIHFQDFPIEFKEINPSDFKYKDSFGTRTNGFEVPEKTIIEPNEDGYIYENLIPFIHLDNKDTVVINAPVGYGKSYAIIKTIEKIYYEVPNSLVIVATPFVSLVQQYVDDIAKDTNIPKEQIYDYTHLGRTSKVPYLSKKVQVVTVNTLLGNPGEDGFKNSERKRKYLNDLINYSEANNKKVFFIYDEIHDAIQNFKEEFIFNLWKWRKVIHKNFIISATFNEASKVVIEYLAELTDCKIQIIESIRKRFPEKQSSLYLHYCSEHNFTLNTDTLVKLVEGLLDRKKNIDILSYSKSLAKSILQDKIGIGKKLKDRFGTLNDCTSELVSNQRPENEAPENRYHNDKCNIGTNFKTGVSIKKKNHAFIIILPPRMTRLWFRNRYGIFSGGINSIIQALARQRNNGEIHIILPRPDHFDFSSLSNAKFNELQINSFQGLYTKVHHYETPENKKVKYIPFYLQDLLTQSFYTDTLLANVEHEIEYIRNLDRRELARLKFPTYELFKLNRGEEFLSNTFKFFGEDIAAYITYGAFTNQFINCNLVEVNYKTTIFFEEGKIQENLNYYFNKYFGEDYYNSRTTYSNFNMFYSEIRNELFSNFTIKLKKATNKRWETISSYSNKSFENQLLRFCGILFYQNNYYYQEDYTQRHIDKEYTRQNYFLDSLAVANSINLQTCTYSAKYRSKIKAFQNLSYFKDKLNQNIATTPRGNRYDYLPIKPFEGFVNQDDLDKFSETISFLIEHDELIKNDIFNFRRNFIDKSQQDCIVAFYKILLEDFFESPKGYKKVTINDDRLLVKPITSNISLSNPSRVINLVQPADYDKDYLEQHSQDITELYGSEETYQKIINEALKNSNQEN